MSKLKVSDFRDLLTEYGRHVFNHSKVVYSRFEEDGKYGLKVIIYDDISEYTDK